MKGRRLGLDGYALEDGQMGAVQDEAMSEIAATAGRKGQKVKYKNQCKT